MADILQMLFKGILFQANFGILIQISLKSVLEGSVDKLVIKTGGMQAIESFEFEPKKL